jgi:hypothetical protein
MASETSKPLDHNTPTVDTRDWKGKHREPVTRPGVLDRHTASRFALLFHPGWYSAELSRTTDSEIVSMHAYSEDCIVVTKIR